MAVTGSAGRVVVTGAGGFLGRNLVPVLQASGHDVAVVARSGRHLGRWRGVTLVDDGGGLDALERTMADWAPTACVHLATHFTNGSTAEDSAALVDANVEFGARVAQAFASAGGKTFVYTSSFSQRRGGNGYSPTNLYAATKQALADILRYYAESGAFQVVDLQLFDTVGPGDTRPKIWSALMRAAWTGVPLATSEGGQLMSPVHVEDVLRAIVTALGSADGAQWSDFHIAGPQSLTLREVVARFSEAIGHEVPVTWGARPYSGNEMFSLWTHGRALPGWQPQVSLKEAFRQMWEEFLSVQQVADPAHALPAVPAFLEIPSQRSLELAEGATALRGE